MSNCKVGDLARVVAPYVEMGRGHFVRVVRPARGHEILDGVAFLPVDPGATGWVCQGNVPNEIGVIRALLVIGDNCLRPIRDPGDDATDESKAWLPPVPTPTKEPA